MTSSVGNLSALSYENIAQTSSNYSKLYVPVSRSALLYSHFEHVSGVAAKAGQTGVSIDKLRILNSMIEHIADIKNQPAPKIKSLENIPEKDVSQMMNSLQKEIHKAMKTPYILSGARPLSGELFSFQV